MQNVSMVIDSFTSLYKAVGIRNLLILAGVLYVIYVHNNSQKLKNENINIERIEKIYKENIERLADQVKSYERIFLSDILNLPKETIEKMTAVTREIQTEREKRESRKDV